jgi:hypothetical protein
LTIRNECFDSTTNERFIYRGIEVIDYLDIIGTEMLQDNLEKELLMINEYWILRDGDIWLSGDALHIMLLKTDNHTGRQIRRWYVDLKHLLEDVLSSFVKLSHKYREQSLKYVEATAKIAKLEGENINLRLQFEKKNQENQELRDALNYVSRNHVNRNPATNTTSSSLLDGVIQRNNKAIPRSLNFIWQIIKNSKSVQILTKKYRLKKYCEENNLLDKNGKNVIGCDVLL